MNALDLLHKIRTCDRNGKFTHPDTEVLNDLIELIQAGWGSVTTTEANARLIAAAPELYEVLEAAPNLSKYHGQRGFEVERFIHDYEGWMFNRRAVLAHARGEP